TKRANYRYNASMREAWRPQAVSRILRSIEDNRLEEQKEQSRQHYLKQLAGLLSSDVKERQAAEDEWRAQEEERRAAEREGRPIRKSEKAAAKLEDRKVQLSAAKDVSAARESVQEARNSYKQGQEERQKASREAAPTRTADRVVLDGGYVAYRAKTFSGEDHYFGVAQTADGRFGVFRQTPDGDEFLNDDGTFSSEPERPFEAADRGTAETLAKVSSLRVSQDAALESEGSTPEGEREAAHLRGIETDLIDGRIDGEQARKQAGLAAEVPEERISEAHRDIEAAQAGMLYGPLHGKTRAEAEDAFANEVIDTAGWTDAEKESALDQFPLMIRMQTEHALNHIGRSGDYLVSRKGTRWTLDSKGVLHPDDGSAPFPLMKDGTYTGQAIQLARSGRVGFGMETREERRIREAKERNAEKQVGELSAQVADQLERAIVLAKQNEGLVLLPGEEQQPPAPEKKSRTISGPPIEGEMFSPEREYNKLLKDLHDRDREARKNEEQIWVNAMGDFLAENHASAWSIVEQIAKNS
ncbi:hypothetical protein KGP36_08245, partial [Patescibacteria group bacterium]|nr:hypothetical protein [Patescibacteria group bacterium]